MAALDAPPQALSIDITADDIAHGKCFHPSRCAAALAMTRTLTGMGVPFLSTGFWTPGETVVRQDGRWLYYASPASLDAWITAFDGKTGVEPATFGLALAHVVITRPSEENARG